MTICNEIQPIPVDWKDRMVIKQYNGNNELVVRTYGKTQDELYEDHLLGRCNMWCNYCYEEAMKTKECDIDTPDGGVPDDYIGGKCHSINASDMGWITSGAHNASTEGAPDDSEPDDDWDSWDHCVPGDYYKNPKDYKHGEIYPNPNDEEILF